MSFALFNFLEVLVEGKVTHDIKGQVVEPCRCLNRLLVEFVQLSDQTVNVRASALLIAAQSLIRERCTPHPTPSVMNDSGSSAVKGNIRIIGVVERPFGTFRS